MLYAPNVHTGGGRVLLLPLLELLREADDVLFILDSRLELPFNLVGNVHRVDPTLISRFRIELVLRRLVSPRMLLLCMGNLPPLFVRKGVQHVFVQNRYLVDDVPLNNLPIAVRFRIFLERRWLRSRATQVRRFIVQTPTMQRLIKHTLGVDATVLPFIGGVRPPVSSSLAQEVSERKYDFLYVASGDAHKNHKNLISAWVMMAADGLRPSLCLTLDQNNFPSLCTWVSEAIEKYELNVSIIGECTHDAINDLYRQSGALIYPSLFESFGLPLIEAAMIGLPILGSNASYVTDVVEPSGVFDPDSPQAIAEIVRSSNNKPAVLKIGLLNAGGFLDEAFNKRSV